MKKILPISILIILIVLAYIGYFVTGMQISEFKNHFIATAMTYYILILVWEVASELDDPLCGIWNIRERIPNGWLEKFEPSL